MTVAVSNLTTVERQGRSVVRHSTNHITNCLNHCWLSAKQIVYVCYDGQTVKTRLRILNEFYYLKFLYIEIARDI